MNLNKFINSIDHYLSDAIEIGLKASSGTIKLKPQISDIANLDLVIGYIHTLYMKELIDETACWNIAIILGTLFGEMIIKEKLYHWSMDSNGIPIVETSNHNSLSPITKIYKILLDNDNTEGTASSFFDAFLILQQTSHELETNIHIVGETNHAKDSQF